MASRWRGRSRAASAADLQQKVQELEAQLSRRDADIAELESKLEQQQLSVKKLRRERDELRSKNASLVGKLAEVSRKNSIQNCTPPMNLPR